MPKSKNSSRSRLKENVKGDVLETATITIAKISLYPFQLAVENAKGMKIIRFVLDRLMPYANWVQKKRL